MTELDAIAESAALVDLIDLVDLPASAPAPPTIAPPPPPIASAPIDRRRIKRPTPSTRVATSVPNCAEI